MYIYIGQYYHKRGKALNLTEKKIGITINLADREWSLNRTHGPIGYAMVAAWNAGDAYRDTERAIHAILGNARSEGEWFEDDDGSLIGRVAAYMDILQYPKVDITSSNEAEKELLEQVDDDIKEASIDGVKELFVMCPSTYGEPYLTDQATGEFVTKSWVIRVSKLDEAIQNKCRVYMFRRGAEAVEQQPVASGIITRWIDCPDDSTRRWVYFTKDDQPVTNPPIKFWKGSNPVKWVVNPDKQTFLA